jgi:hypothetical protein
MAHHNIPSEPLATDCGVKLSFSPGCPFRLEHFFPAVSKIGIRSALSY